MANTRICGFCMTGHHQNCKSVITYYDKIWHCACNCEYNKETKKDEESLENDRPDDTTGSL
jgi:hypothetical protein